MIKKVYLEGFQQSRPIHSRPTQCSWMLESYAGDFPQLVFARPEQMIFIDWLALINIYIYLLNEEFAAIRELW